MEVIAATAAVAAMEVAAVVDDIFVYVIFKCVYYYYFTYLMSATVLLRFVNTFVCDCSSLYTLILFLLLTQWHLLYSKTICLIKLNFWLLVTGYELEAYLTMYEHRKY